MEQTINWSWWKIMIGMTSRPMGEPAKITFIIGMPVARLFLEPQKMIAIRSSREKRSLRERKAVSQRTTTSRRAQNPSTSTRESQGRFFQTPLTMAWLNAV